MILDQEKTTIKTLLGHLEKFWIWSYIRLHYCFSLNSEFDLKNCDYVLERPFTSEILIHAEIFSSE